MLHTALTEPAASVLGYEKSYQPDWFRESFSVQNPLLQHRNRLYTTWLAKDHVQFKGNRSGKKGDHEGKNDWFVAT